MTKAQANESQIIQCLYQGDLIAAKECLETWAPTSAGEKLRHLYCWGKIHLYEGSYSLALQSFQAYDCACPFDLDVLCDLTLCFYQLGLQMEMASCLQSCLALFEKQILTFSSQTQLNQGIFIAKLLEEQGRHKDAQNVLARPEQSELTPKQSQSLRIQQLRIAVEVGEIKQVRSLYDQVISGTDHTLSFEIEREHALLLADALLFEFPQVKERFEYALTQNLTPPDQSFLKSEMAELAILSKNPDYLTLLDLCVDSESGYEKEQARVITAFLQGISNPDLSIIRLEKTLSRMSLVRLLRQVLFLFPEAAQFKNWAERYRFHCSNIPSRSVQEAFLFSIPQVTTPSLIIADSVRKTLSVNGQEFPMKSNLFWGLLKVFPQSRMEVGIDETIEAVYSESPNPQHFDRLRIGIYRLNESLEKALQMKALFKITKNKIILLSPIREQRA